RDPDHQTGSGSSLSGRLPRQEVSSSASSRDRPPGQKGSSSSSPPRPPDVDQPEWTNTQSSTKLDEKGCRREEQKTNLDDTSPREQHRDDQTSTRQETSINEMADDEEEEGAKETPDPRIISDAAESTSLSPQHVVQKQERQHARRERLASVAPRSSVSTSSMQRSVDGGSPNSRPAKSARVLPPPPAPDGENYTSIFRRRRTKDVVPSARDHPFNRSDHDRIQQGESSNSPSPGPARRGAAARSASRDRRPQRRTPGDNYRRQNHNVR
ncbi:unnamed protein product, partial [Amoebophrya sp. A25]